MKMSKPMWIAAGLVFAAASLLCIHYEAKVRLHVGEASGVVTEMGNLSVGQPAPDFTLPDLANQPLTLSSLRGQNVAHEYGVRAIPVFVVVDKHGLIRRMQAGYSGDHAGLHKMLEQLTGEPWP